MEYMTDDVILVTVQGPFQEENVCAFLGAHGIPSRVRRHAAHVQPFTVNGLGAVTILVSIEHAAEARELLAQVERGELELPTEDGPDT